MKLVSFYDIEKHKAENRVYSPATASVIEYIALSLKSLGLDVEIISAAETKNKSGKYNFRTEITEQNIRLTQCSSKGHKSFLLRGITKIKARLWLVIYLLRNTKNNEVVFFWDSPVLYESLILFKKIDRKNVKILYFASEIFQEVIHLNRIKRKMEWHLFSKADKLIVSTEMLNEKINPQKKPYLILNGSYKPTKIYTEKFDDELIHIVYAGVINNKKGSSKAIEIAKHLTEEYHIHILGYGKDEDLEAMNKQINESNLTNRCKITYEGVFFGEEYNRFIQKCDIGLCPQNLNEKYNESSFPSKILSYMANGLRVVSVELKAVRLSDIGEYVYYSRTDNAIEFAEIIKNIKYEETYNSRKILADLDKKFRLGLEKMIKE